MSTFASDKREPSANPLTEKVPLSGAKLDAAIRAMESAGFFERLTMRIMKLAAAKGFYNPFDDEDVDLPGGKAATDLANDIIEKALDGSYTWDDSKHPDFYRFCWSRAESILSNWLAKNRRMTVMSSIIEESDGEEQELNCVNTATDGNGIYTLLRFRDGGALGNRLLEDFALSFPDTSREQNILMAIHDDRECIGRAYCRGKLSISETDYDSAMKRIRRAAPTFLKEWCRMNNINEQDRKEVR